MGGFPTRPSRLAFGPTRTDDGAVVDHDKYVAAQVFNLDHWQTAGLGVVAPRAWALMSWSGSAMVIHASGEAWDPDGGAEPTPARSGAGAYTLTYDSTYPDEAGNAVATGLVAGAALVQALGAGFVAQAVPQADGRTVDVEVRTMGGVGTDQKVLVLLW